MDATLKIFTVKNWGAKCNYKEVLDRYKSSNIEVHFVDELNLLGYKNVLDYLYAELKSSDCSMIICKDVNFGVGFTAVLDAMVCSNAIIATYHKDNPIDIDKAEIGVTVPAKDVKALRDAIKGFIEHPEKVRRFKHKAWKMIEEDYNIRNVARRVLNEILQETA